MYEILLIAHGKTYHDSEFQNLTEEQAEKICEMWGWTYDDGKQSYTMAIAKQ